MPQAIDRRLLTVVRDDLRHVVEGWSAGDISDASLRRDSTILRRLLVHGDLAQAWRASFGQRKFIVTAPVLKLKGDRKASGLRFATATKVKQPGLTVSAIRMYKGNIMQGLDEDEVSSFMKSLIPGEVALKLNRFIASTCLWIAPHELSRRDVIQYVANKLGGAHYDRRRTKPSDSALEALGGLAIADRDAVYFELLGIGQQLGSSADAEALLVALDSTL